MICSNTCIPGARVAPHPAIESVRVAAFSSVGGIGSNILWASKLPVAGRMVVTEEASYLANGGTTISMGASKVSFPAHPAFFQMSRHDISHLVSVVALESMLPNALRSQAPTYFNATLQGEVAADFVDGLFESVIEYRQRHGMYQLRQALDWDWRDAGALESIVLPQLLGASAPTEGLLVPPTLTLSMQPERLVAYTTWDTICDNLKLQLHLLPARVPGWHDVADFHIYAGDQLAQDIAMFASTGVASPVLDAIRMFFTEHYGGLDLNYTAMMKTARRTVTSWEKFFADSAVSGSMEGGYVFRRGSRFDTGYVMSKCAHAMFTCPVNAPTVHLRPELYADRPDSGDRYRRGTALISCIIQRLQSSPAEGEQRVLLARLNRLGQIGYAVTLLPSFLQPERDAKHTACTRACSTGP